MVFDAFIQQYPRIAIILISLVMTLFITVVRYFMTDREKMKEIRDRQKKLRAEMKLYKNHPEKMMKINKKMMEDFPEQMRQSFKPMIITIIPVLLLFTWMKAVFVATAIANTWLWWYIGASIVLSIIVSKLFGLQ
ncbi:DUF106 domain-containing protein [Candidatus Pacearchaeota archaeon]|nr:DUF106 domain-containing protein [Candidatus Pacearchaeota archaeon]